MEYFEAIRTVEVDVAEGNLTKSCRVEVLRSSCKNNWYRIELMELRDYNMYPAIFNTGQTVVISVIVTARTGPVTRSQLFLTSSTRASLLTAVKRLSKTGFVL